MKTATASEKTKKARAKNANEWQKEKIKQGGYRFTVVLTDTEIAKEARSIPNKTQFLKDALEKLKRERQNYATA